MAHFALLRQRIKVIQSIQKTASAMRLIAMSLQSRLRKQQRVITAYADGIAQIQKACIIPEQREHAHANTEIKTAVILISSRKGLCGTFNEQLFSFFEKHYIYNLTDQIIAIGTYGIQYIRTTSYPIAYTFNELSIATFATLARTITQTLLDAGITRIIVYSQHPRTLFIQHPEITVLEHTTPLPLSAALTTSINRLQLQSTVLRLLYNSLLAEQSARFLSMNSATQDAEELLTQTKLEYNKARQAYVTRELIELTSAFTKTQ